MMPPMARHHPPSFEAIHLNDFLVREHVFHGYRAGLRRLPPVTCLLVLGNVLVHVAVGLIDGNFFGSRELDVLVEWGARSRDLVVDGEVWRLLSCVWLHGDSLHLGLNMLALFGLGRILEAVYGWERVLLVFAVSGLTGSLAGHLLGGPVSVGASGAIFGLLGAGVTFGLLHGRELPASMRRVLGRGLLPWVALNIVIGFVIPRIDNAGHVGGLLGGALVAAVLADRIMPWSSPNRRIGLGLAIAAALMLLVPLGRAVIG